MTNEEILLTAMKQSAIDSNCSVEDFCRDENVIVKSENSPDARRYLNLPFQCDLVTYGKNIVASVSDGFEGIVKKYIDYHEPYRCFETPRMQLLNDELMKKGCRVCFMAEYFLPDVNQVKRRECGYELRVLTQEDFADLYVDEWSNALCERRKHLDVLGVGAYDNGKLVGLAACSADCDTMWQIGVDVLPEYRRQGIASTITGNLAMEIMERGKVPFYCCAWSNISSARNAINSGFRPAWVEITAKPEAEVAKFNE